MKYVIRGALILVAIGTSRPELAAQTGQQDGPDCAAAEAVLRGLTAKSGRAYYRAIQGVMHCPQAGPYALRLEWSGPPKDTVALRLLGDATSAFRDRRLFETTREVVMQTTWPRDVRLTALRVFVSYFDPYLMVSFRIPDDTSLPGAAFVAFGGWAHPHGRDGAEPLQPSVRADILSTLTELESDPTEDPVVGKIAGHLRKRLASRGQ